MAMFLLFVFGWIISGVGIIGQPHVMSRVMTIDHPESLVKARSYYFIWNICLIIGVAIIGLCARVLS